MNATAWPARVTLLALCTVIAACSGDGSDSEVADAGGGGSGGDVSLDSSLDVSGDIDGGTSAPLCADPAQDGRYAVTRDVWTPDDPQRGGTLDALIWYPSAEGSHEMAGAPYPLVVLSHGFLMEPATYDGIARRVASHGFVVVGTKHVDTAETVVAAVAAVCNAIPQPEQFGRLTEVFAAIFEDNHAIRRPEDLVTLMDAAAVRSADGGDLEGLIDANNVGAIGHSFGGFTSLAAAGAELDTAAISEACAGGPALSDLIDGNSLRFLICSLFATTEPELLEGPIELRDDRISAMVSLAAPVELLWGEDFAGLAALPVPVMLAYTDTDESVAYESGPVAAYPVLNAPKYFLTVLGGNHGNFGEIDFEQYEEHVAQIPEDCTYRSFISTFAGDPENPPELPNADQVRLSAAAAAGFLQMHVAGAVGCEQYLTSEYFEGIGGDLQTFVAE